MPALTPDPYPGRTSPLFLSLLLWMIGYRVFRTNDDQHYDNDVMLFLAMTAATLLMTQQPLARAAVMVGGVMRAYGSTGIRHLGAALQASSLGFAIRQSWQTTALAETSKISPRLAP